MIKVVITRPVEGAKETIQYAMHMGFVPIPFPLLRLSFLGKNNLKRPVSEYNWILFTSSNAVKFFMEYYNTNKIYFTQNVKIAAVGPSTEKTLNYLGLKADFVPTFFNRSAISEQIPVENNDLILYPTILDGPTRIEAMLKQRNCYVDRFDVYKSKPVMYTAKQWQALQSQKADVITFFSPRTVQAFFDNRQHILNLNNYKVAVLAESSETELKKHGCSVQIKTQIPTTENLLQSIKDYYE